MAATGRLLGGGTQTLEQWLANKFAGVDLATVTKIDEGVPEDVTGTLNVLANCTALTDLNLRACRKLGSKLEGSLEPLANCTALVTLNLSGCNGLDGNYNKVSEGLTGSFESLSVLVNLRSINLRGCTKIDRSRAFELLASWDWAAQLESLDIAGVEGELK